VLLSLALGHAGPYGTFDRFDLLPRLGFWLLVILLPCGLSKTLFFLAKRYAPDELSDNFIVVLLVPLIALLGSACITLIGIKVGLYNQLTFFQVWPYSILVWLIFAFVIILPMILIAKALAKEQRKVGVTTMMEFFHHKLPDALTGSILIALKAEDHYLRVFTDKGSALILMKFEDALSALNGYPGIQTHRSWWVSSEQLKKVSQFTASNTMISLHDGTEVPVSRRKRKQVNDYIANLGSLSNG